MNGPPKVLVIGLDCAEPSLVFERFHGRMPFVAALMEKGAHGPLTSTLPPITVPAWASMLTSRDPGQLGLYGFRNRASHGYEDLFIANSSHVRATTLYQHLGRARLTSILLGVPLTYPPKPIRGLMVSSFLAPSKQAGITYPPGLVEELDRAAGGDYIIDVPDFRTEDKDRLLSDIYKMTQARFKAAGRLVATKPWDFFMMVEMGPDRLHHGFWRFHAADHRLYEPGHRHEHAIRDYYQALDAHVERLVGLAPAGTLVMIVSDHGARTMVGGFALNAWLMEKGYLKLKTTPAAPAPLRPEMIDWPATAAWGEGGYYGRLFINVAGREPEGLVRPGEYEQVRARIAAELAALPDHEGRPMGNRAFRPQDIYREVGGVAPDLIVYFGDLAWRSVGLVGSGQPLYTFTNDTGPDDANHAAEGLLVMGVKGGRLAAGGPLAGASLYDIAPTVLRHLGVDIPPDMIGRPLETRFYL